MPDAEDMEVDDEEEAAQFGPSEETCVDCGITRTVWEDANHANDRRYYTATFNEDDEDYDVDWFTNDAEEDLCGECMYNRKPSWIAAFGIGDGHEFSEEEGAEWRRAAEQVQDEEAIQEEEEEEEEEAEEEFVPRVILKLAPKNGAAAGARRAAAAIAALDPTARAARARYPSRARR